MFEMIRVPQREVNSILYWCCPTVIIFYVAPIFVANSLILISVRYDITTSQTAHRRILKVSEFIYGVYGCKDEFERASYDLYIFLSRTRWFLDQFSFLWLNERKPRIHHYCSLKHHANAMCRQVRRLHLLQLTPLLKMMMMMMIFRIMAL